MWITCRSRTREGRSHRDIGKTAQRRGRPPGPGTGAGVEGSPLPTLTSTTPDPPAARVAPPLTGPGRPATCVASPTRAWPIPRTTKHPSTAGRRSTDKSKHCHPSRPRRHTSGTSRRDRCVPGGEGCAPSREAPGLTEIITRRREWPHRGARRTTLTPLTVVPASAPRQVAEGHRQGRAAGHRSGGCSWCGSPGRAAGGSARPGRLPRSARRGALRGPGPGTR